MADDKRATAKSVDKAEEKVQTAVDQETEQGFRGVEVDKTPNEHYTVSGVLADKPVPENAADPAAARRDAASS
jgi:hypothetical protein